MDSYLSVSDALYRYKIKENDLRDEMESVANIEKTVRDLLSNKRTVIQLKHFDSQLNEKRLTQTNSNFTSEINLVKQQSVGLTKFWKLIADAKRALLKNKNGIQVSEPATAEGSVAEKTDEEIKVSEHSAEESPEAMQEQESTEQLAQMVNAEEKLTIEQVERKVVGDCKLIGMKLPPIDADSVPRFSLPINKVDFTSLIVKAFYFRRR